MFLIYSFVCNKPTDAAENIWLMHFLLSLAMTLTLKSKMKLVVTCSEEDRNHVLWCCFGWSRDNSRLHLTNGGQKQKCTKHNILWESLICSSKTATTFGISSPKWVRKKYWLWFSTWCSVCVPCPAAVWVWSAVSLCALWVQSSLSSAVHVLLPEPDHTSPATPAPDQPAAETATHTGTKVKLLT